MPGSSAPSGVLPVDGVTGADGCRGGWLGARASGSGDWEVKVHKSVAALWDWTLPRGLILIDIPIGLRDRGAEQRGCDVAARRRLGAPRAASVFTPPARPCVYRDDWPAASDHNAELTGRRLSRQAWNIRGKIREVDAFLRADPARQARLREVHPELLFLALNDGVPMRAAKRLVSGRRERLAVLERHAPGITGVVEAVLPGIRPHGAGPDDLLDAMAGVVAAHACGGSFATLPEHPETDGFGLRMEILYPAPGDRPVA